MDAFGLHPESEMWLSATRMMIRNIPARCTEGELRSMLNSANLPYKLEMPKGGPSKCKGFAFVTMPQAFMLVVLARVLWQSSVPTRESSRKLKIHPADMTLAKFAGHDLLLEL
ncbi:unnamed protein product, partial [Symbiodinium necroappetens]